MVHPNRKRKGAPATDKEEEHDAVAAEAADAVAAIDQSEGGKGAESEAMAEEPEMPALGGDAVEAEATAATAAAVTAAAAEVGGGAAGTTADADVYTPPKTKRPRLTWNDRCAWDAPPRSCNLLRILVDISYHVLYAHAESPSLVCIFTHSSYACDGIRLLSNMIQTLPLKPTDTSSSRNTRPRMDIAT